MSQPCSLNITYTFVNHKRYLPYSFLRWVSVPFRNICARCVKLNVIFHHFFVTVGSKLWVQVTSRQCRQLYIIHHLWRIKGLSVNQKLCQSAADKGNFDNVNWRVKLSSNLFLRRIRKSYNCWNLLEIRGKICCSRQAKDKVESI